MSEILGYKPSFTAKQRLEHHIELLKQHPSLTAELDHVYDWMSSHNFVQALKNPTKNQIQWLKTSMEYPPERLLDFLCSKTDKSIKLDALIVKTTRYREKPLCYGCELPMADDMKSTVHFSTVMCTCPSKTFHNDCADEFMLKQSTCHCCKKCIKLKRYFSDLQSILLPKYGRTSHIGH